MDLIVRDKNGIEVQCLYYGTKRDNMVSSSKTLYYGDILTVSNLGKYILGIGWFVLIIVNGQTKDFVRIVELENAIDTEKVQSVIDVMLDSFALSIQIDNALERRNEEQFLNLSKKQNESSFLIKRISGKLPPINCLN